MTTCPLEQVAEFFDSLRPVADGAYWLYAENKKLKLNRLSETPEDAQKISLLTGRDINEGPTSKKWNGINSKLHSLRERGKL